MNAIVIAGQSNACQLWNHLARELEMLGVSINVIDGSAGGTALLQCAAQVQGEYWLNEAEGSPLSDLRKNLSSAYVRAVWWIQGENEAKFGPVSELDYLHGLIRLRELFAEHAGFPIPFVISPIAGSPKVYPYARPVLAAQYRAAQHGFLLGPEYYDLPTNDEVHLTEEGRMAFAKRAALVLHKTL